MYIKGMSSIISRQNKKRMKKETLPGLSAMFFKKSALIGAGPSRMRPKKPMKIKKIASIVTELALAYANLSFERSLSSRYAGKTKDCILYMNMTMETAVISL